MALENKYFVKKKSTDSYVDATTLFDGVKILTIANFNSFGDAVNVYHEQWIDSNEEDFLVTTQDGQGNDVVVRSNVDLELTFIVSNRYTETENFSVQAAHDSFISFMCSSGDIYIKSAYTGKEAHVICLAEYAPTQEKLHRGKNSYIMGTIKLHLLDKPAVAL